MSKTAYILRNFTSKHYHLSLIHILLTSMKVFLSSKTKLYNSVDDVVHMAETHSDNVL